MQQTLGPGDVARLGRFVAGAKQDDDDLALLREVDAIAGPYVDPELMNPSANAGGVAQVSKSDRFQARQDSRFGLSVRQIRQPAGKDLGLANLEHTGSVSVRIRSVKALWPDSSGITFELSGGPTGPSARTNGWAAAHHSPFSQNDVRGVLRRHMLNAFIATPRQVNATKQALTRAEKHRRDGDVQLIYKPGNQILPHRAHTAA